MKEDFVTYDLAVKLKEKGFREYVRGHYKSKCHLSVCSEPMNCNGSVSGDISAPQIHEVLKWLREEKKLYIEIWWLTQHTTKNLKGFQFVVTPICENPQRETDLELYCDYETSAIKGIEYVIDNLI